MPQYYVPDLNLEPHAFVASIDDGDHYTVPDIGGDGHGIEEELNELENRPDRGSTAWGEFISQIKKAEPLKLQGQYLLERQDKKHRMGDLLDVCLDAYKIHDPGDKNCEHFYKWLDSMSDWDRLMLVKNKVRFQLSNAQRSQGASSEDSNIQPSMVRAFMKGVAYLDQAGRRQHRLRFVAGTAMLNGVEFDTKEMQTVHSGRGFAIWVISEKGRMYAGNHVKGMLHHSSFLAGANIMCGGEMKAGMGKILFLSGKTGHYQAATEHMVWALSALEPRVDNFDEIKVLVFKNGSPVMLSPTFLRFSPGSYDSWGVLKESEKEAIRKGDFSGFPNH